MSAFIRVDHGLVWTNGSLQPRSLLIDGERIKAVLDPDTARQYPVDQVVDASKKWILPGGIDLHVHISDGVETFPSGSSCAAAGGISTVMDMAPFHACVTPQQFEEKITAAQSACVVDFGLVAGIVIDPSDLHELPELARLGAAYFKVFQPSEPPVTTETLWKSVQMAARTGLRLGLHAEESALIESRCDPADPLSFARSRPVVAETSAAAQMIEMAKAAGAPVHICHVSAGRTAELVDWAKAHGVDITCEVPAHFLLLDETAFSELGARVKTTPPLRSSSDVQQLWQALAGGVIDAAASDHYTESLVPLPADPALIPTAAAGIAGLEVSLPLLMDQVCKDRLSLDRFVDATAQRPATIANIADRKGRLEAGMDADFTIWDPEAEWEVAPSGGFSRIDTTPFLHWQLQGRIWQTWVRGRMVWNGQDILVPAGYGNWVESHQRRSI